MGGDRPRGEATLRQQVIAWLDAYASWPDGETHYPALTHSARRLTERLRDRWPADTHSIGYLPAFRDLWQAGAP